jgi:hypothetical protein
MKPIRKYNLRAHSTGIVMYIGKRHQFSERVDTLHGNVRIDDQQISRLISCNRPARTDVISGSVAAIVRCAQNGYAAFTAKRSLQSIEGVIGRSVIDDYAVQRRIILSDKRRDAVDSLGIVPIIENNRSY